MNIILHSLAPNISFGIIISSIGFCISPQRIFFSCNIFFTQIPHVFYEIYSIILYYYTIVIVLIQF